MIVVSGVAAGAGRDWTAACLLPPGSHTANQVRGVRATTPREQPPKGENSANRTHDLSVQRPFTGAF